MILSSEPGGILSGPGWSGLSLKRIIITTSAPSLALSLVLDRLLAATTEEQVGL